MAGVLGQAVVDRGGVFLPVTVRAEVPVRTRMVDRDRGGLLMVTGTAGAARSGRTPNGSVQDADSGQCVRPGGTDGGVPGAGERPGPGRRGR